MTTTFPELHPASREASDLLDDLPVVLVHGGNVAGWMWEPQLEALQDRTVVTPDLPGFGRRTAERWPGLDGAADDLVARVEQLTGSRRFHVVGLSLGGSVGLHLAARHPDAAASVLVSGAPLLPVRGFTSLVAGLQLALWNSPWFWKAMAAGLRLPVDARERYVTHGLSVHRDTARAMFDDVRSGGVPPYLDNYPGRLLLVAGERDSKVARESLRALPHAEARLVPGMHHVWNVEGPALFNAVVTTWLAGGIHPALYPLRARR
ncbi:alpha/beta fold hydrolase [Kribbella sp. HUAS MG21]|uniref:Alpha/beta fold hydrolase n=1 Tax=Kribbella sp. HUAS MG21 TaxID=3160966 RepID=A0AAU7TH25_9ACTN